MMNPPLSVYYHCRKGWCLNGGFVFFAVTFFPLLQRFYIFLLGYAAYLQASIFIANALPDIMSAYT